MPTYLYTDVTYGVEETGMPKVLRAGSTVTAGKELSKEIIDQLVADGLAGDDKRDPVAPAPVVADAATGEEIEAGTTQGKAVGAR